MSVFDLAVTSIFGIFSRSSAMSIVFFIRDGDLVCDIWVFLYEEFFASTFFEWDCCIWRIDGFEISFRNSRGLEGPDLVTSSSDDFFF